MNDTTTELHILSPIVQYIFAGLCVALLGILFWIIRKLMNDRDNHFKTLGAQVRAIGTQVASVETMTQAVNIKADAIRIRINSLPCDQHEDLLSGLSKQLTALAREKRQGD